MPTFLKRLFGLRSHQGDASGQQDPYQVGPVPDPQGQDQSAEGERAATGARKMILGFALLGGLSVIVFAVGVSAIQKTQPFWPKFAQTSGMGLLLCLGFFAIGGLFGFLFGIPRASRRNSVAAGNSKQTDSESEAFGSGPYSDNTNLEEISDWLTKIIVGLGLIDLKEMPSQVKRLSEFFAQTCGSDYCSGLFLAIGALFLVAGFVFSYVLTHVYLPMAFKYSGDVIGKLKVRQVGLEIRQKEIEKKREEDGQELPFVKAMALTRQAQIELSQSEQLTETRIERLITWLNDALKFDPENELAYVEMGRAVKRKALLKTGPEQQKLLEDALKAVTKALEIRRPNASASYNTACYKALLNYPHSEILADLKTAFDLNPNLKKAARDASHTPERVDPDLKTLEKDEEFKQLTRD